MKSYPITPILGMNNSQPDESLRAESGTQVRDAVNVNIEDTGTISLRAGLRRLTHAPYKHLWQSPLHGDVFATLAGQWVRVNPVDWSHEPLVSIGDGRVAHAVLNNRVVVAGPAGLFAFDGAQAAPLTVPRPAAPLVQAGVGGLHAGKYGVALGWLRGELESPLSPMTAVDVPDTASLEITFPMALDPTITGIRLYLTRQNGGQLNRAGDYPIGTHAVSIPQLPKAGAKPQWQHMEPMPTGPHLGIWKGRLVTASANVLRFSEAMAYHVHDPRHGFVKMPQRITFVAPVDGGIWVGQVNHVAFLAGAQPQELTLSHKAGKAPVPFSCTYLDATMAGEISGGGSAAVAWLADNGFVLGTPGGQLLEPQGKRITGIRGNSGTCIGFGGRLTAAVE